MRWSENKFVLSLLTDEAIMMIEKESVYFTTDPYSEEVIPQSNGITLIL